MRMRELRAEPCVLNLSPYSSVEPLTLCSAKSCRLFSTGFTHTSLVVEEVRAEPDHGEMELECAAAGAE